MRPRIITSMLVALSLIAVSDARSAPTVGPASIGGIVVSADGPEGGVWVIAESTDLPNRLTKIVVTDDQGRFVVPELPQASYKVWSRGYGLIDSQPVETTPGKSLRLKAAAAESPAQAAQIYPANYWSSLLQMPDAKEFPGTGPSGNGISPAFKMQQHWISHLAENCQVCHQLGTKITRELPLTDHPSEAWAQRIQKERSPEDPFFENDPVHLKRNFGARMSNLMTLYGRERGLKMFADWTTRIAKGEVPPASPPRPTGVERNLVITLRDIGDGRFLHDSVSSDKRNPTVNANGPVYGIATYSGMVVSVDPSTGQREEFKLTNTAGEYFQNAQDHTGAIDSHGRVWTSSIVHMAGLGRASSLDNPAYCTDDSNPFAKYFPMPAPEARLALMFDPRTKKSEVIPVCYGTHHLNFDENERLYFSGDTEVAGWVDVKTWEKTKDLSKAVGWCPLVLDTNGDGKITPDRTQWNQQLEGIGGGEGAELKLEGSTRSTGFDPKKDTRIAGFGYGMGISPKDRSYWTAKFSPYVPSGVLRVDPGAHSPQTCSTEYYEAPKVNGEYVAYNARGVDVDADGIAWVAFGSGMIGRFDRSKCKVLNGPTATGQQCPEGWELIPTPGPKFKGLSVGTDWFYLVFVDHHDALGLGKGVPIFPNSVGDELLAYLPKGKPSGEPFGKPSGERFVHLRVPYPLGFYARGVDGRIDNVNAGWKGRGLWATNNVVPVWHQETGEGSSEIAAHFQLRPSPLSE